MQRCDNHKVTNLDEIKHDYRRPVPVQKLVKMLAGYLAVRIRLVH